MLYRAEPWIMPTGRRLARSFGTRLTAALGIEQAFGTTQMAGSSFDMVRHSPDLGVLPNHPECPRLKFHVEQVVWITPCARASFISQLHKKGESMFHVEPDFMIQPVRPSQEYDRKWRISRLIEPHCGVFV